MFDLGGVLVRLDPTRLLRQLAHATGQSVEMIERQCKRICLRCGYFESCADLLS